MTLWTTKGGRNIMKSKHFQKRMSQRAISDSLVEIVRGFGTQSHDGKIRLDRKSIRRVLVELESMRKTFISAERKGGVVVVVGDEDLLVTTYQLGH